MDNRDEALQTTLYALGNLSLHRSPWVKEVSTKAIKRVEALLDKDQLDALRIDYEDAWRKRNA